YPLVAGEKLLCVPGGCVVALNRKTGELLWKTPVPGGASAYGVTVPVEIDGKRHYLACLEQAFVGIDENGKVLWSSARLFEQVVNRGAPIARGPLLFFASTDGGGNGGFGLLKLLPAPDGFRTEEVWKSATSLEAYLLGPVLVDDHVYLARRGSLT